MNAHYWTTLAYVILAFGLLHHKTYNLIQEQWGLLVLLFPETSKVIRGMFGTFILSCAIEHGFATYYGHHHWLTVVISWIEAGVSMGTALIFLGVPFWTKSKLTKQKKTLSQ